MSKLKYVVSKVLFWAGFGIALHDACHHLYELGGYKEILSLQGIYFGFAIMIIGYLIVTWEYLISSLKQLKR